MAYKIVTNPKNGKKKLVKVKIEVAKLTPAQIVEQAAKQKLQSMEGAN